jgi:co-chaperonin GroES (HSP10)
VTPAILLEKGFRLLGDRILVRPDELADKTAGGLIIPETAKSVPRGHRVTVVLVGPGMRLKRGGFEPMPVKPGDVVWVDTAGSRQVYEIDGVVYWQIWSDSLRAIEEEEAAAQ